MFDHASLGWFDELNRGLRDQLDDAGFARRIVACSEQLQTLALEIIDLARRTHPELATAEITRLINPMRRPAQAKPLLADIPGFTSALQPAPAAQNHLVP